MAFSIIVFERIPNKWVKEDSVGVLFIGGTFKKM